MTGGYRRMQGLAVKLDEAQSKRRKLVVKLAEA